MEFYGRLEYPVTMVLSLRVATVESNGEQSEEDNDFLDHLRSFEKENLRVITVVEIQKLGLEHKKLVINYFVYHEQIGLVADYENSFLELKLRAQVWNKGKFDEKWVVSILVRGQKEEIKDYVKLCCPDSLHRAIVLAKWQELCVTNKVFYERAKRDTSQDGLQLGKLIEEAKVTRNNGKEASGESATNYVKDNIGYLISFNVVDNLSIVSIKLDKQAFDAKQKGKDCFICKKRGHRAKDCPDKKFSGGPYSAKICLKCGQSGHEMFSCKSDYSSADLKEIQCYICKSFGHLSCVTYSGPAVGEVSCYRCGQSGHTGLACTSLRGKPNGTGSPSSCYKCGEGGHFARECTSSAKAFTRSREETPSSCYRCGGGGHFARECTSSAKASTRLHGEPNGMGSPSSCYKCGEEGHFARECNSSAKVCTRSLWEPNDTESPSSCYKCGEEGHFGRECTNSSKTPKRKRELSTPKSKHLKQRKNYFEGRSLPRDLYKTRKRDKPQYERSSTPSKSKCRGGWITEDPGDFPHKKARTNSWKSPPTPKSKNKKFPNSTGRSYASNSRASMKFR